MAKGPWYHPRATGLKVDRTDERKCISVDVSSNAPASMGISDGGQGPAVARRQTLTEDARSVRMSTVVPGTQEAPTPVVSPPWVTWEPHWGPRSNSVGNA